MVERRRDSIAKELALLAGFSGICLRALEATKLGDRSSVGGSAAVANVDLILGRPLPNDIGGCPF
jgi:hypothetical protein